MQKQSRPKGCSVRVISIPALPPYPHPYFPLVTAHYIAVQHPFRYMYLLVYTLYVVVACRRKHLHIVFIRPFIPVDKPVDNFFSLNMTNLTFYRFLPLTGGLWASMPYISYARSVPILTHRNSLIVGTR